MSDLDLGATIRGFTAGQKVFNRYTLKKILGQGGMGVVWLASDEELKEDMALKFLPQLLMTDRAALEELKRETKRARSLSHSNIVRIYDFEQDALTVAIAMEYISGDTLSNLRLDQPGSVFTTETLRPWVEQTCSALTYAHVKARVVHRDLKPANLLLDAQGEVKLADFGIARSISDSVSRTSRAASGDGSLPYMSPQQLLGRPAAPTDDVYSLGATIYELLTGKPPFFSGGMAGIFRQIESIEPPTMTERRVELEVQAAAIPAVWEEVVAACLAKDPAKRPQSAAEVWARVSGQAAVKPSVGPDLASAPAEKKTGADTRSGPPLKPPVIERDPKTEPIRTGKRFLVPGIAALLIVAGLGYYNGIHRPEQGQKAEMARSEAASREAEATKLRNEREQAEARAARLEAEAVKLREEREKAVLAAALEKRSGPKLGAVWSVPQLGLAMHRIDPGEFMMGSPADEAGRDSDEVQHRVGLTQTYWLGRTEVTMGQWRQIMGTDVKDQVRKALADDTLYNLGGKQQTLRDFWGASRETDPGTQIGNVADDLPMIFVSWTEAMEFCRQLNARERSAGRLPEGYEYSLPTETQWEYACRAGSSTATPAGAMKILGEHNAPVLDAIAWYGGNSSVGYEGKGWKTDAWSEKQYPGGNAGYRKVGTKEANAWGLHDMLGNVFEWCQDWYGNYPGGSITDPAGPTSGTNRVSRGGCWVDSAANCRSASRDWFSPGFRNFYLGFRLALSAVR